jgi:hypothetical protein
VNPIVDVALAATGELTFSNAAVDASVAPAPAGYRATWSAFDNTTRELRPIGTSTSSGTRMATPANLPDSEGAYIMVAIASVDGPRPSWAEPVHAYFRRMATGWTLVGFERLPDR